MKKKIAYFMLIAIIGVSALTGIALVKADTTGNMTLTSEVDVASTANTHYGKPNIAISYSRTYGSGTWYTHLQKKQLFGNKTIATSGLNEFTENGLQVINMFNGAGEGSYLFQAQWRSGAFQMSYSTYSYNIS